MRTLFKIVIIICITTILVVSCKTSQVVSSKVGAQLWSENCMRCHYAPSPTGYSDKQWEIVGTHMQVRGQLTQEEKDKIIEFLKSAN